MIRIKKLMTAAILTTIGFASSCLCTLASDNAAYVADDSFTLNSFDEASFLFHTNGHTSVRYSFDKGKSWVNQIGFAPGTDQIVTIDLSSLSPGKDAEIMIAGMDGDESSKKITCIKINKETKFQNGFKMKYKPAAESGVQLENAPAGLFQTRTVSTASWKPVKTHSVNALITDSAIAKLEPMGGTYFIRTAAILLPAGSKVVPDEDKDTPDAVVTRPGKIASVKIPAQAKSPKIHVDYLKGVISFPKYSELTLKSINGASVKYYTDLTNPKASSSERTWLYPEDAVTSLNIVPFAAKGPLVIEVRLAATDTKKQSHLSELTLNAAPEKPNTSAVNFDYVKEIFDTEDSGKYEYTLVHRSSIASFPTTQKWTAISFTKAPVNITSKITALTTASALLIRAKGNKSKGSESLPSDWTVYAIDPRPILTLNPKIDFFKEQLVVDNPEKLSLEYIDCMQLIPDYKVIPEGNATLYAYQFEKRNIISSSQAVDVEDLVSFQYMFQKKLSKYPISYRIAASPATAANSDVDFTGEVASLAKSISMPNRPTLPKPLHPTLTPFTIAADYLPYNWNTQEFYMTPGAEYVWYTKAKEDELYAEFGTFSADDTHTLFERDRILENGLDSYERSLTRTKITETNKLLKNPIPAGTGPVVFRYWIPATATSYEVSWKESGVAPLDYQLSEIDGVDLTDAASIFSSGNTVTTVPIDVNAYPNYQATLKFMNADSTIRSGDTITAKLTIQGNVGHRFNCIDNITAKNMFTPGGMVTEVKSAAYSKPGYAKVSGSYVMVAAKIVYTLTIKAQ